ncbi:SRPBCC family protein [Neptuniibacter sp. QD72_48]|uniref:SRPBCC family protein n=1 Tax=unclassified Neptuniibacter TaxID=2630693 RepID=UPI0039F70FB6
MLKKIMGVVVLSSLLGAVNASAAGNIAVEESVKLNVKPSAVWALLGDYNGLYRWHPAVASSDRDNKVRVLTLGNGAKITETLLSKDEGKRSYRYQIDESPLPVSDYESEIQVKLDGQGGSIVVWSSSFNAAGASDAEAEKTIRGVYQAGLQNLDKLYN